MSLPSHENRFLFSEHLGSTQWLSDLPKGYLKNEIDLDCYDVRIRKLKNGYHVYVGPIEPYSGGSAISITLDRECALIEYETELLAPVPK